MPILFCCVMAKVNNELLRGYQSIPKDLIFDNGLSDRARFVYVYMSSKPDGWDFYLGAMSLELGYSVDTLRKYLGELISSGWIVRGKQSNEDGRFGAVEYTIKAYRKKPCTENTDTEKFLYGNVKKLKEKDKERTKEIEKERVSLNNNFFLQDNNLVDSTIVDSNLASLELKEKEKENKEREKEKKFDIWWCLYDKKMGKKRCFDKWMRLSDEERDLCIANTPSYVASTPNKQFRKHPLTYLNGECWNDEVITPADAFAAERGVLSLGMVLTGDRDEIIERSKKDLW